MNDHATPIRTRVVTPARIVHNDLELGSNKITQTRQFKETEEQQLEFVLIFRSIEAIRYLDTNRYTRVALHTDGPLIEYWYDEHSVAKPDSDHTLQPFAVSGSGRWLRVDGVAQLRKELEDKGIL